MSAHEFYNNRLYRDFDIDTFAGTLIFAQDYADHCLKEVEQRIAEAEKLIGNCLSAGTAEQQRNYAAAALARLREVKG